MEVFKDRSDGEINLGRACLLIALEEEAAVEMHPELESALKDVPIKCVSMHGKNKETTSKYR